MHPFIFYFLKQKKFPKNPASNYLATLANMSFCVGNAHVLYVPIRSEVNNPMKLNNASKKVNRSRTYKGHPKKLVVHS